MNITYKNPGFTHSMNSILSFLTGNETPFWSESILYFYPQIDRQKLVGESDKQKYMYLRVFTKKQRMK